MANLLLQTGGNLLSQTGDKIVMTEATPSDSERDVKELSGEAQPCGEITTG